MMSTFPKCIFLIRSNIISDQQENVVYFLGEKFCITYSDKTGNLTFQIPTCPLLVAVAKNAILGVVLFLLLLSEAVFCFLVGGSLVSPILTSNEGDQHNTATRERQEEKKRIKSTSPP